MNSSAFTLTLLGAITWAIYNIVTKKQLEHWKGREAVWSTVATLTAGILLLLVFGNFFEENKGYRGMWWLPVLITGVLNIGIFYLATKAKSLSDVSLVTPIGASSPTIVVLTSAMILGDKITILGWFGIMLTALGTYLLNIEGYLEKTGDRSFRGYLAPWLALSKDKGVRCAFAGVLLGAVAINFDGMVARQGPSIGISFGLVFLIVALGETLVATWRGEWKMGRSTGEATSLKMIGDIVIAGSLYALTLWLVGKPLEDASVPYIATLKRLQIPVTIILAFFLLGEKTSFKGRLLGGTIMAVGSGIIAIS